MVRTGFGYVDVKGQEETKSFIRGILLVAVQGCAHRKNRVWLLDVCTAGSMLGHAVHT